MHEDARGGMREMDEAWITSVGIDIGTSTTKMIASRLRLGRTSSSFALPRYEIVERRLTYEPDRGDAPAERG